jgi:hypothetical protein
MVKAAQHGESDDLSAWGNRSRLDGSTILKG